MGQIFDTPISSNDQSIDRVLSVGLPVVLVFLDGSNAQVLDPFLKRLAQENAGQMLVVKIQVKENPATSSRFKIGRTPAAVGVRNGQELSKAEGISPTDLEKHAAYLLGKGPKPVSTQRPPTTPPAQSTQRSEVGDKPRVVTDATFDQEVLGSSQPVLVDFWAPWCGPCRITDPMVEKLAREMAGRLKVAKVNVDENPAVVQRYAIYSIPTMMIVKNGQIADRWAGALPEPALRGRLSAQVGV